MELVLLPYDVMDYVFKRKRKDVRDMTCSQAAQNKMSNEEWEKIISNSQTTDTIEVVEKPWGHYKVLYEGEGYTVKELTILPGKSLSDQRHFNRDEHWLVIKGELHIDIDDENIMDSFKLQLTAGCGHSTATIDKEVWHRPYNDGTEPVIVVEVWLGESSESDIERRNVSV